ncbi:MAG: HAD family hydrolase [Lachnospiraceae bacterium]
MIKIVFFDIDGTLLSHKTESVPKDAKEAIAELQKKGIKVCVATGRHIVDLEAMPLEGIVFDGYVTLNGQLIYNEKKERIFGNMLSKKDVNKLYEAFVKKETTVLFINEKGTYLNFVNDRVKQVFREVGTPVPKEGEYTGEDIYQAILIGDKKTVMPILTKAEHIKSTYWNPYAVDVIDENGGKIQGIQQLLQYLKISMDEVMAFGDGENDIEMIQNAAIGIAMGNGLEKVKEKADYVTTDIDEGGVKKALEHFRRKFEKQ